MKIFVKWTAIGQPDTCLFDLTNGYNSDLEISNLFGASEIQALFPNETHDDLISWFYLNHKLYLKSDGNISYIEGWNGNDPILSQTIAYSGLTIINDVVVTENAPTPTAKQNAVIEITNEYNTKQKAHFVNGVEFHLSLKGEDYEQFKSSLTTSAVTSEKAIVIIQSVTGVQYKCPDLPFEILKIIFNLVDPYSKNNFDKKGVILRSIIQSTTDQELQTALARKSEFESPATVNINNICDTLLNNNTTPQSIIDWLNEKKEVVNNQNVYHIFNQSN